LGETKSIAVSWDSVILSVVKNKVSAAIIINEAMIIGNIPGPGTPWLLGGYPMAMAIMKMANAIKTPDTMKLAFLIG
jgi:hypothetical protein